MDSGSNRSHWRHSTPSESVEPEASLDGRRVSATTSYRSDNVLRNARPTNPLAPAMAIRRRLFVSSGKVAPDLFVVTRPVGGNQRVPE